MDKKKVKVKKGSVLESRIRIARAKKKTEASKKKVEELKKKTADLKKKTEASKKRTEAKKKKKTEEKKKPIKFKVVKKKEEPKKKVKKFNVKKPTIGKKLTGLTKAQMNKLPPEKLFGLLSQDLKGKIVKDARINMKEFLKDAHDTVDGIHYENIVNNIYESMAYYDDYSDYLTPAQEKFFIKHNLMGYDNIPTEKKQIRFETIEQKLMEKVHADASKYVEKGVKKFGQQFKDKKALPGDFEKEINKFFDESNYEF